MASPFPPAEELRAAFDRDGFVRIAHAFSVEEVERLRASARQTIDLARAGRWPYVRTLPKQFPPWTDPTNGIWGVQHLLHPDMPERNVFAKSYFHYCVLESVTRLLQCKREQLVLELYNMLIRPDQDFALRWHRDDIPPDVSPEEEIQRLKEPVIHAQWNLALYNDSSLIVIPGSHKRSRTTEERNADPYEDDMPGQKAVRLAPGDLLFYNNNILHRGIYDSETERMTLHGSMGVVGEDKARARNILQHGIGSWAAQAEFDGLAAYTREIAEHMQKRLIAMGSGENVGYSLQN